MQSLSSRRPIFLTKAVKRRLAFERAKVVLAIFLGSAAIGAVWGLGFFGVYRAFLAIL